jgi:type IV pilus assembly protein PilV
MMRTRRPARGVGLIDALIALTILAFGLLGLTRMQGKLLVQSTEAQQRMVATQFTDELLNTMLVDSANAQCYSLPAIGTCGSTAARARADDWRTRALGALPGNPSATSLVDTGTNRMTVRLTWSFKEDTEPRMHEVISDIRRN